MKAVWTLLFVAVAAAILGIAILLVPETGRTDKFWISMGGLGFGLLAVYVAFTFRPAPQGEQAGSIMRGMLPAVSVLYFVITLILALVAVSSIAFKWLAVVHILALLFWIVLVCVAVLGAGALANADRRG